RYGSDKADLRYGMELVNLVDVFEGSGFRSFATVAAEGGSVKALAGPGAGASEDRGLLVVGEELLDGRSKRATVLDDDPHESRRASTLGLLDALVELLASEGSAAGCGQRFDRAALGGHGRERPEPRTLEDVNQIDQFHPVAEVRLVRAVPIDHLVEGHPSEGCRYVDALRLGDDPRVQRFDQGEDVLLVHEGHLDVELRELEPAVGARRLVAQAAHDLVVPVLAADHQQLLELLRGLG